MFSNIASNQLSVLESKFEIYENLSKEMLDKLERAVASISESSNRVAIILERHQLQIDEASRADEAIMRLIEKVETRMESTEKKVDDLVKFRWITFGVVIAITSAIQFSGFYSRILLTGAGTSATVHVRPK
jgi:hypothetical protein